MAPVCASISCSSTPCAADADGYLDTTFSPVGRSRCPVPGSVDLIHPASMPGALTYAPPRHSSDALWPACAKESRCAWNRECTLTSLSGQSSVRRCGCQVCLLIDAIDSRQASPLSRAYQSADEFPRPTCLLHQRGARSLPRAYAPRTAFAQCNRANPFPILSEPPLTCASIDGGPTPGGGRRRWANSSRLPPRSAEAVARERADGLATRVPAKGLEIGLNPGA